MFGLNSALQKKSNAAREVGLAANPLQAYYWGRRFFLRNRLAGGPDGTLKRRRSRLAGGADGGLAARSLGWRLVPGWRKRAVRDRGRGHRERSGSRAALRRHP